LNLTNQLNVKNVGQFSGLRGPTTFHRRHFTNHCDVSFDRRSSFVGVDVVAAAEASSVAIESENSRKRKSDQQNEVVDHVEVGRVEAEEEAVAIFWRNDVVL
jgi:hypothetical protein